MIELWKYPCADFADDLQICRDLYEEVDGQFPTVEFFSTGEFAEYLLGGSILVS